MFLLLEAERILLYYKTIKGTILAVKSTGKGWKSTLQETINWAF